MPGQFHARRVAAKREHRAATRGRSVLVDEPQRLTRDALVAAIDAVPGLTALDGSRAGPSAVAGADAAVVAAEVLRFGVHPLAEQSNGGDRPAPVVIIADHGPASPLVDSGGVVLVSRETPLATVVDYLRSDVIDIRSPSRVRNLRQAPRPPLTVRERQVLGLLASGLSPTEVARGLAITTNTARDHIKAIREKLDRPTIMAAVLEAIRTGLLASGPG
jgi:DNA-binding CsgD family transcriptional regulator